MILEIIIFIVLAIFAYMDLRTHQLPSFATTIVILGLLLVEPQNLIWGISALVFGWFLYEFDFAGGRFFGGLADVKVITIIGLMLTSFQEFSRMMIFTAGYSVILSIILYYKNNKKMEEIPFIPVLLLVYVTLILMRWFL